MSRETWVAVSPSAPYFSVPPAISHASTSSMGATSTITSASREFASNEKLLFSGPAACAGSVTSQSQGLDE